MLTSSTEGLLLEPPNAGLRLDLDPKWPVDEAVLAGGVRKDVEIKTRASNSEDWGPIPVLSSTVTGSCGCVALLELLDGRRSIS